MRWLRWLLYSLLTILALVAIALVLVFTVDLGRFKGNIETIVSEALERELEIAGALHVKVGRNVEISAENARLASADWADAPDMASLRRLEATVDTWSLIRWPIVVESLTIDGVRLNLELSEEHGHSWQFGQSREETAVDEETKGEAERFRLPVLADGVRITDTVFVLDSPERPNPLRISAREIAQDMLQTDQVRLTLDGDVNDTPFALNVTAAGVQDLVEFRDVEFGLDGNLGEITFNGTARFADLLRPSRPVASLDLTGPNIEYLTDVLELPRITTGPLQLRMHVAPLGEKMQLDADGRFGEFTLLASGQFDSLQELDDIELRVSASGPDAGTIASLLGNDDVPQDPFNVVAIARRSGSTVDIEDIAVTIGETQVNIKAHFDEFPKPHGANMTVRINGPDIGRFTRLFGLPGRMHGPFQLQADLVQADQGGADVDLRVEASDMELAVRGDVTSAPDLAGTELVVRYRGENLRTVMTALDVVDAPAEPFDLTSRLRWVSDGVRLEGGALSLGDDILTFNGMIGKQPLEAGTEVSFELVGPDLAGLLGDFGRDADELPYAPYRLSGKVSREPDRFLLHETLFAFGESLEYQLRADGYVTDRPQLLGSRVRAAARGASLGAITRAVGIAGIPAVPFDAAATIEIREKGFAIEGGRASLGDDEATVSGLVGRQPLERDTDLAFSVTAPDFKATLAAFGIEVEQLPAGTFSAEGEIRSRGDYFALRGVTASLAGANAELSGRLGALPDLDGTDLDLSVSGDELTSLLPEKDVFASLDKRFSLSANVQLDDRELRIPRLDFDIDRTSLTAKGEVSLEPMLGHGRIAVTANSPDLFVLSAQFAEFAVADQAPMDLELDLRWANTLWTVDRLTLKLVEGTLESSGTIDGPPNFDRTDLSFEWIVASLNNFSVLAGRELPDQPAHLKFRLVGSEDEITFDHFDGVIGDSDISGNLVFRYGELPDVDIELTSNRVDLVPYLPPPAERSAATVPAPPKSRESKRNRKVIPDTPLPIEMLEKFLADVDVRIGELVLRNRSLFDVVLDGSVVDGQLTVDEFNLRNAAGGELRGRLGVVPLDAGAEVGMRLNGNGLRLGLPAYSKEESEALPTYDINVAFITSGVTVRDLAANLNGYLRVVGGEGRIKAGAFRIFTNDFLFQLLNTLNPFAKTDPYMSLKCSAVLATVADGQVKGEPVFVVQSEKLNIFANAKIDLKTEKLRAEFNTVPQKGLGLSLSNLVNPYVMVGGTLGNPSIGLDPEGVLIEGGAAVATAGLSILAKSFKDRFLSARDPCAKAIADAEKDFAVLEQKYGRSGDVESN